MRERLVTTSASKGKPDGITKAVAKEPRALVAGGLRLGGPWALFECREASPPSLVGAGRGGAVLQGSLSCAHALKPGSWSLGSIEDSINRPRGPVSVAVLAAPERPDRDDMPKYDRAALVDISLEGDITVSQEDGVVARLQLGNVAWLKTQRRALALDARFQDASPGGAEESNVGCRKAGALVFCEGTLPGSDYSAVEDTLLCTLPQECRPEGGRRCYLSLCCRDGLMHLLRLFLDSSGHLTVRRSHTQGRARDGHLYEVAKRQPGPLELNLGSVKFCTEPGTPLELLAGARAPRQHAARKQLSYLGLQAERLPGEEGQESPRELDGFQVAICARHSSLVVLDGAVCLTARHRYTAFARLPADCWPERTVTLLVGRGMPNGRFEIERLDVTADGECLCPQLPEDTSLEHVIHLGGAVFGVPCAADASDNSGAERPEPEGEPQAPRQAPESPGSQGQAEVAPAQAPRPESEEAVAWRRLKELEQRDRRFRGKFRTSAEFMEFERTLQWFRAHDCTESHRLTHSCFKGRSDFTQTGMLVFDTEEDLEGLNKAIARLYDKRIPVVLMERQTRIFPMIFDIDLKVCQEEMIAKVPDRIKNARPWNGPVDFCRWHGADWTVIGKEVLLLRHLGLIIFQFFPDLPLIDICVFNASGWDRVKKLIKVSIHLVAPYVLVTPERLTAIRERMLEYLGECSEHKGHPLQVLLEHFERESDDNTWDKIVDQTVTSGTNGLRMPYCDKAQRTLKREFLERKARGEVFSERELVDQHAYVREEAGRPCLPEGILRIYPVPPEAGETALPQAKWMCYGDDLPIDEWIRLGRCRYAWRVPLAPQGPTPWRPPLRYQWAEPSALWEDRSDLKGSPVVRRFHGTALEFRQHWTEALQRSTALQGRWLASGTGARWRGGLREEASHEVRFVASAGRAVLLLAPEAGAARVFAEFRRVLAGWTEPDDTGCVPLCGSPSDSHSAALHTIITPSEDFPDVQSALDAVPVDEPLHRVLICGGVHELPATLVIQRPVLLEGEGRWETTLRTSGVPVLRFEGQGACAAMVRNLRLELQESRKEGDGAAAVEMKLKDASGGEPAIVGCTIRAEGRWGTCIHATGSAPQIVRSQFSAARWGVVLVGADGRVEDNEFVGLGESALVIVGGAPWVHRNSISDCGGSGILTAADCHAVLEANEVRDCLTGVRVLGKRSEIQMRTGNRLLHNGLCDEHQLEAPPGVIPCGATATVRSCRPFPFLPKDRDQLLRRLTECTDAAELTVIVRAARRHGLWREAAQAHGRLAELRRACAKGPAPSAAPAACEVAIAGKAWDGRATGYGEGCVAVEPGSLCEVWRRDSSGWMLVATSAKARGWCSPHVLS